MPLRPAPGCGLTRLRRAAEREEDFLLRQLAGARDVLEVGPGAGRLTSLLAAVATRLTVCDSDPDILARLIEQVSHPALVRRLLFAEELDQLPGFGSFDAAVALRVLPLARDWERALWSLCDAVRPGGLVAFDLWRSDSWPVFLARRLGGVQAPGVRLPRRQIASLVQALPLEIVGTHHSGYPSLLGWDADPLWARLLPQFAYISVYCGRRR